MAQTRQKRLDQLMAHTASAALAHASRGRGCHLVGGTVRDALLDLPCRDFDAVVERDGAEIADDLSTELGARLVHLGGDRFAAYRIVGAEFTVDLWDRQNQPLEKDLDRRDFTVNSMALDLDDGSLVDPCGGDRDLSEQRLRATSEEALSSDPLRVLRLARFVGQLPGFAADTKTHELARLAAPALAQVASERIREELRLALEGESVLATVRLLIELGVFPGLWTDWMQSDRVTIDTELLSTFERLELLPDVLPAPTVEQIDVYLTRTALILDRLAQTSATPVEGLVDRSLELGYLTKREARDIRLLFSWDDLPGTTEEQRWLLHLTGPIWPSGLAYHGTRTRESPPASNWPQSGQELIELVDKAGDEIFEPTPFLTGTDIQRMLHIPPGPDIGDLVALLKREQIEGRIANRADAEAYLLEVARARLQADGTPSK